MLVDTGILNYSADLAATALVHARRIAATGQYKTPSVAASAGTVGENVAVIKGDKVSRTEICAKAVGAW